MVDNMIQTFMQTTGYHLCLNWGTMGKKLKVVAHTYDANLLIEAMRIDPRVEDLNTRNCTLEGFKLFWINQEEIGVASMIWVCFHRLDKVNYTIPKSKTKSSRAHIEEFFTYVENVVSYTTNVSES